MQEASIHEVLARARRAGRRTIVGGPGCTTSPERFGDADCLWLGEAEGRVDALIAAIETWRPGSSVIEAPAARPSLADAPIRDSTFWTCASTGRCASRPREGVLSRASSATSSRSSGVCRESSGRPRSLPSSRALFELGHRGEVFVVDDNFIGNKEGRARHSGRSSPAGKRPRATRSRLHRGQPQSRGRRPVHCRDAGCRVHLGVHRD